MFLKRGWGKYSRSVHAWAQFLGETCVSKQHKTGSPPAIPMGIDNYVEVTRVCRIFFALLWYSVIPGWKVEEADGVNKSYKFWPSLTLAIGEKVCKYFICQIMAPAHIDLHGAELNLSFFSLDTHVEFIFPLLCYKLRIRFIWLSWRALANMRICEPRTCSIAQFWLHCFPPLLSYILEIMTTADFFPCVPRCLYQASSWGKRRAAFTFILLLHSWLVHTPRAKTTFREIVVSYEEQNFPRGLVSKFPRLFCLFTSMIFEMPPKC